jgi:hypothetical protein
MTPLSTEYQREAAYAMEMADRAPNDDLRALWLGLAAKWLDMLSPGERTRHSPFDIARQDTGSRGENSPASN